MDKIQIETKVAAEIMLVHSLAHLVKRIIIEQDDNVQKVVTGATYQRGHN